MDPCSDASCRREKLFKMQTIPNRRKDQSDGEGKKRGENDQTGSQTEVERLDHVDGLNEVNPKNEIDDRLRPPQRDQHGPA